MIHDVVIVGAGPAGAACAYHLAKAGARVLILEKEKLPREKPCGGGVSPEVGRWFDFDFAPVVRHSVRRVRFSWNGGDATGSDFGTAEPLWLVRRDAFDHFLVQQAVAQGAELRDGCPLEDLRREGERWELKTPQGPVAARFLVAADGAKGTLAKRLGLKLQARAVAGALEAESPLPSADPEAAHLDFGLVPGGYAWNFPKADCQSIGLGTFRGRAPKDLRQRLGAYCEGYAAPLSGCHLAGHPLALWDGDQRLHAEGALVVGEAACVVDPLTAEGIRPSMYSGVLAARALQKALSGEAEALAAYSRAVAQEIGRDMAWAKRLAQIFYMAPGLAYRLAVKHPQAGHHMARILTGEARYADLAERALRRLRI
jgi:geranylgeranyl reductase family protein